MPHHLPIVLDGSAGEGGGQILRTALALAAITGKPFAIDRIRANREKAGLRPQHREAARAVARLCDARLEGDEVGATRLEFVPRRPVRAGEWAFDIGTAGSTPLLFQTVCWPLALAGAPSTLTLRGGTHQDHAPSFHYLALVWAPAVARLGFRFELGLQAAGFYPEGGGEFTARVEPAHAMPALDLRHRGTLQDVEVVSMVCGLGFEVAERQAARAMRLLRDAGISAQAERVPLPSRASRGGHVLVVSTFQRGRAGHGAVGEPDRSPEETAEEAVRDFRAYLEGGAALDRHLGDQLLLPAALLAAGLVPAAPGVVPTTRYTVHAVTKHLTTNADVIRRFLDVEIAITGGEGEEGDVRVQPPGATAEVVPLPPSPQ
ncbi:RNA 3'-terminal phosphate cyclase [Anaeromyxobacter sp. Fw109-5]|uniref:RNA 3'-terminal phosphate cyclase n=1 Tax=Anaeromyxobacter sp. (strain Fw109-5) TaxID=404589 RepID=UPI0000ED8B33|nr:RNA 3'-terminal phosphate cyclase [Anaeromyxobacter sp. Fw109-5]ABS26331.1 RNA-3'-phosphate cyclase [Anaeromyxobacter sp. Fw109-5]